MTGISSESNAAKTIAPALEGQDSSSALLALADDIQARVDEISRTLDKAVNRDKQFRRWKETAYRRTLRYLRRQLAEERALTAPHDDDVLDALAGFDRPASATEIAERVYRRRPPHSAIVRIGLTLVRLAETGRVTRVPVKAHGENRNRWEAIDLEAG